jgi:hypothetical protein
MQSVSKRKNLIAQFDHPMRVTVRRGEFEPVESIGLLDVKKLSRGSHKVHIGSVTGGCCPSKTFATVRNGSVVDVYVEACKGPKKKLSKEAQAIIKEARRRGHLRARRRWTPVPVTEFFSSPAQMARIVISGWETDGGGCLQVCWGSGPILDCVWCCVDNGELDCGFVQVIVGDVFER